MDIEVIGTADGLDAVAGEWEFLHAAVSRSDIFAGPSWYSLWWRNFAAGRETVSTSLRLGDRSVRIAGRNARPNVMVFREGGAVRAIAPLVFLEGRWKRFPCRILTLPLNNQSPRSGLLFAGDPDPVAGALARHLAGNREWDVVLFDGIPAASGFVPAFRRRARQAGLLDGERHRPWFHSRLEMEGTWEEFLAAKSHKSRKNMNQAARYLSELGEVKVTRYAGAGRIGEGLKAFFEIDCESWKRERGEIIAADATLNAYYPDLVDTFSGTGRSEIWILTIGGEPAAGYLCLKDRNVLYTLKTSFRAKYVSPRYSPGTVLLVEMFREVWGKSAAGIDFCGWMPLVDRWTRLKEWYEHIVLYRNGPFPALLHFADRVRRAFRKGTEGARGAAATGDESSAGADGEGKDRDDR